MYKSVKRPENTIITGNRMLLGVISKEETKEASKTNRIISNRIKGAKREAERIKGRITAAIKRMTITSL